MNDGVLLFLVVAVAVNTALMVFFLLRSFRRPGGDPDRVVREESRAAREESARAARELREELAKGQKSSADSLTKTLGELGQLQVARLDTVTQQLKNLTETNNASIEALRTAVDNRLKHLQESNEKRLDEMRRTVDEKLQDTLEKRLGESFKLVSERLEAVQKGLGEMQSLAAGVGDLKRVLTNVKTRGTWGEIQLGAILEQILTPDQFGRNIQPREDSREVVEYAVRLPGQDGALGECIWLPIDSKFPQEDYLRLTEASEAADPEAVQKATAALVRSVRNSAQDINEKYINPPATTNFALMFLPTEGLYAEVLRQPGLVEQLQRDQRVVVAGPTTLAAILNSLRMGFQTLAIEKRASEVWRTLAAVKTEFGKFGDVLTRVKKQLDTASRTIDQTGVRTRAMEKKLREVAQLPSDQATALLGLEEGDTSEDDLEEEEPTDPSTE